MNYPKESSLSSLLLARNVTKTFGNGKQKNESFAVDDFSMVFEGSSPSITALVGESGSGKTTIARMLLGLIAPSSGEILYRGRNLQHITAAERREFRRDVQIIFQDPFEVYNPVYKVDHLLSVPIEKFHLASSKSERNDLMDSVLNLVGLDPREVLGRYPHQLSGGQRQRIAIARVLLIRPRLIIADEPVSMVDASHRASILTNLQKLNTNFGISILYITHDLATAYQVSENMVVLYRGSVVEAGDVELLIKSPKHPYTQLLIDSIPEPDPEKHWGGQSVVASSGGAAYLGKGCKFANRCPYAEPACRASQPPLYRTSEHQVVACVLYKDAPQIRREDLNSVFVSSQPLKVDADSTH
jgi:peptide/nickel transport system ATP-binding protein